MSDNYCSIYLVRHGETVANVSGVVVGQTDSSLTENGLRQIEETAEILKDIHFDAVFSSDLLRAKRTAEVIAKEKALTIATSEALRERFYGIHEGSSKEAFVKATQHVWDAFRALSDEEKRTFVLPDGMETNHSMMERFIPYIREIAVAFPGKNVLVVTHGSIMRNFLIHIGYMQKSVGQQIEISNGAYFKIMSDGVDFTFDEASDETGMKLPK